MKRLTIRTVSAAGLLTVAALTLSVAAAAEIARENDTWSETITEERMLEQGGSLSVRNSNGTIDVQSWDEPTVRIVAHKEMELEKAWWQRFTGGTVSDETGLEKFESLKVVVDAGTNEVQVRTEYPDWERGISYRVNYEITVPRGIDTDVRTSNGQIEVEGVIGALEATSSNGKIVVKGVDGSVFAESSNGGITCEGVTGTVDARTSNGSITVRNQDVLNPTGEIRCATSNGGITVALDESNGFELSADTSNGSIKSEFPLPSSGADLRKHVNATVGAGGPKIDLTTSNGSISVEKI
ncbi:MAG: DUF4097 family beta strand repeat protein [Candidatus Hydrogenedentes bacterium]|nr:DUF4097 family beta strand repeat protein [Candidatus Hydrogenedentota bacterium]